MITAAAHFPRHAAWFLCLKVENMDQNWPYQTCYADEKLVTATTDGHYE